jgi:hypothetical protein
MIGSGLACVCVCVCVGGGRSPNATKCHWNMFAMGVGWLVEEE